jgi:PAS domain S-box-containing protein
LPFTDCEGKAVLHRLLQRQLKKLGVGEFAPPDAEAWQQFLERVSRTYTQTDQDRYLLERSLSISSEEMQELYEKLRQASETRLAAERDKLQAVISSVGDGLCALDQDGGLLFINPEGERLLGWHEAELVGRSLLDLVEIQGQQESPGAINNASLHELVGSGQPYRDEDGRFRRKDGSTFPVSYVVNPMLKDGEFLGAVLVFRDITERKLAEAKSQRHLQEMTLLSQLAMLIASAVDLNAALHNVCTELARFLQVSQAGFALLNPQRTAAEVIADYHLPGSPSALGVILPVRDNPSMMYILENKAPLAVTNAQTDPLLAPVHGIMRRRNVQSILIVPIIADGEVIGTLGFDAFQQRVFNDADIDLVQHVATQVGQALLRKQAEEALQKSEEQFRSVTQSANDAIISVDGRGIIISWNKGAQSIFGYQEAEALGQPLSFVMPARYKNAHQEGMERLRLTGESRIVGTTVELEGRRKDGSEFPLDLSLSSWQAGDETFYSAIIRDITERKRAEEELHQAKDAAEAASRAKSTFLANMSHELRTPLNAIIGYSELLQEEASDLGYANLIPDLQKIGTAGRHLLALVNDVLDLSKIEAGKMELQLETFDLVPLIENVAITSQPLAAKNDNTLQVDCPNDIGHMHADLLKVRQILLNLLSNAAKFTHQGRITFTVTCEPVGDDTDWIRFRVADTGIGMTPEQMLNLFQPFTQADPLTTREYGGTGLGLALSYHFCKMMGGMISVESEVGQGSIFTVRLPAAIPAR